MYQKIEIHGHSEEAPHTQHQNQKRRNNIYFVYNKLDITQRQIITPQIKLKTQTKNQHFNLSEA